ncbi:MAG: Ppx/GppA phosphatase family protein [Propionibacteriaceae bacterium]
MRVGVIDCGTNSVRLLIAESGGDGAVTEVCRLLELTRLGQGVDATGEFAPEALERTLAAVSRYADVIAQHHVDAVRFVATSAARDARNREAFFAGVRERLGIEAEIISGDEEARLSFAGARSALPQAAAPVLVIDIGGGSTELVVGRGDEVTFATSLNMGSVRLRERFLHDDPPTAEQIESAQAFVEGMLDASGCPFDDVASFIGVAGTVTTLSGAYQRLSVYDRDRVHGSRLSVNDLTALSGQLLTWSVADTLRYCPSIQPKRAEVICGGSIIAERIAARVPVDMVISEADILDGIARELLQAGASQ